MTIASASDIFFDQLKDLRSAKLQVASTLPDLADSATDEELTSLFKTAVQMTDDHLFEIDATFGRLSKEPGEDVCKAMAGLIEGGNNHIEMAADARARDSLLIAHTTRILFYLMAAARFTRAIAAHGEFTREAESVGEILADDENVFARLRAVASGFNLEIGEVA